jgi:hypothetical protein
MRVLLIFTFWVLSYNHSFSQTYGIYFFGDKYKNYKGLNAKLDLERGGTHLETKVFSILPKSVDDYDGLVKDITKYKNTVFVVDSVIDFKEDQDNGSSKIFKLVDKVSKEKVYYIYDTSVREYHYLFTEFGKGGFDTSYDSEIERIVDDFNGEVKINSPLFSSVGTIFKYIKKGKTKYYLRFNIGSIGIYKGRGVYVLFTDGSKWSRPSEEVDVDYSDGFDNNVFMDLTLADLEVFRKKTIKKIRLYIHDKDVEISEGERFRNFVSVVIRKK